MSDHTSHSVPRGPAPPGSFPRQYARTQRHTLGEPRNLTVTSDSVVFLRSPAGADPANQLWRADLVSGNETLLADPASILAAHLGDDGPSDDGRLSAAERARRERMREGAGGITSYAMDQDGTTAVFSLDGLLFVTDLSSGTTTALTVPGPVYDPHLSPAGDRVAYVRGPELVVVDVATSRLTVVASETRRGADLNLLSGDSVTHDHARESESPVSWGSADFIAAEEMHRFRGFWWSPDGDYLAVCRVDEAPVQTWYISDPASPGQPPRPIRYPAAGTTNALVELYVLAADGTGETVRVDTDTDRWPYLASVSWNRNGLIAVVQTRSQHDVAVLNVNPADGAITTVWTDHDDAWVEIVPGAGVAIEPDSVVMATDHDGARHLIVVSDGVATTLSPPEIQVRSILAANDRRVVVTANPVDDATVQHVWVASLVNGTFTQLTLEPGIHTAVVGVDGNGDDVVVTRASILRSPGGRWILPTGHQLRSFAEEPLTRPRPTLLRAGTGVLATAVLLPRDHNGTPLPVLLDPYGGPHAQRVVQSYNAYTASQWFADQGFAVVITDGRGTPGRGTTFERSVLHNLSDGVLEDQIAGLHAAAEQHDDLDLSRVAIRGWSFGGYLAALAVLKRPDVFHAAIAGAPVTEWRLYDTHYTERYLGDPNENPDVYDANSLLPLAADLTRPLLLIHGLADDNVVAAHTLQLSSALLAAGRPHEVLPLVGVSHMTPQEVIAENLLLHQLDFLRRALGVASVAY